MAFALPKIDLKNPRMRNAALIIVAGLVIAALWYQYVYIERQQTHNQLKSQRVTRQNDLNAILAMKPQLDRLKREIRTDSLALDSLKSIFPDQKEIPKLIREITTVAAASGIITKKFTPLPDVPREYYIENRYNMTVAGGYHQLANFFSFFANLPLIINLSNVSISSSPGVAGAQKEADAHGGVAQTITAGFEMTP
ncbi:MAG: type 4a pilus biogenesis protein PilO, partial [Chitinivibrionales bacterium]|nr:type 4a pilus biogenesis protein PilO [Chitinivibrionales bacterium]